MLSSPGTARERRGQQTRPVDLAGTSAPAARILLAAAEPATVALLNYALQVDGHDCLSPATIDEASELLTGPHDIDLVLCVVGDAADEHARLAHAVSDEPGPGLLVLADLDDQNLLRLADELPQADIAAAPFTSAAVRIAVSRSLQRAASERDRRAHNSALETLVAARTRELAETATSLQIKESQLSALVSSVPVGVLYSTDEGGCEYANEAAQVLAGRGLDGYLGNGWFELLHADDRARVLNELHQCREHDDTRSFETRMVQPDGTVLHLSVRLGPVHDDQGADAGYVATLEDVTARKRVEQELEWQATHDPLTGLPNRTVVEDRIASLAASGTGVVALLDLDGFKAVNDAQGHAAGDRLLIRVARHLAEEFREGFTVGRFGGDEFVIVCDDADQAADLAGRVLGALDRITTDAGAGGVSASVGIAAVAGDVTAGELLRQADTAMYRAKTRGGAGHAVFSGAFDDPLAEQVRIEAALRRAISDHTLEVWFQPQVDCATGHLVRVESLVRWRHPDHGLLAPGRFLPLVEELGLMNDLTALVVQQSLEASTRWAASTPDGNLVPVSINAGALDLDGTIVHATLADAIRTFGTPPGLITLEVTEESLLRDLPSSAFRLDAIRELGVRIALDDFGYGHSSVSYLNGLPLDQLKIDRSFIEHLGHNASRRGRIPQGRRLISALIGLARTFGLEVVAEGVEQPGHYSAVAELGCDLAQGFLIAAPAPADDPWLLQLLSGTPYRPTDSAAQVAGGSTRSPSSSS